MMMRDPLAAYRGSVQASSDFKESKKKNKKKDKKLKSTNVQIFDSDDTTRDWRQTNSLTTDERKQIARDDAMLDVDEEEFQPLVVQDEKIDAHLQYLERQKSKTANTGMWKEITPTTKKAESPPRRIRHDSDDEEPVPARRRRHDSDDDMSPPRRSNDLSPRLQQKNDLSPKRSTRSDDLSPPRSKSRNDDLSPPRSRQREDLSPRRSHRSDDLSPPRSKSRRDDLSPPRTRRDEDLSPPRSRQSEDISPPRRSRRSEDLSPPRSKRSDDLSPPRSKRSNDLSPPRKKRREDLSPPRGQGNPGTVYRDAETGKRISLSEYSKQRDSQNRKKKKDEKKKSDVIIHKQEDMAWGSGLTQKAQQERFQQAMQQEAEKPFSRYENDAELDSLYKDVEREGDPMAHLMKKKRKKKKKHDNSDSEEEFVRPMYRGTWSANRFGIPPGHRWDGVDRSNGFERRFIENLSQGKARQEEAHKWSTEDM
jgi:pre-mRNA-splicing factor CWC26